MTGDQGVQERECSFHLRLDGELDGGFNRVQFVVEQLNLFLGQGRESVIHVSLPEGWLDCAGSESPLPFSRRPLPRICVYKSPCPVP